MKNPLLLLLALTALFALPAAARAEGIVLRYSVAVKTETTTVKVVQGLGKPVLDTKTAEGKKDYAVTLMPQHLSIRAGDEERIYDFIEKTCAQVNHADKTYKLIALHALPLENHKMRSAMTQKSADFETRSGTGKMIKTMSGYMLDAEGPMLDLDTLYAAASTQKSAQLLRFRPEAEKKVFETDSGTAAEFTLSGTALPESLRKTWQRFLVYGPTLHPEMEKAIGQPGRAFATLSYATNDHTGTVTKKTWTLAGQEAAPAAPPAVPAGYARHFHDDENIDQAVLTSQKDGPTIDHYAARVDAYVKQGDALRAIAAYNEMMLSAPTEKSDKAESVMMNMMSVVNGEFPDQVMRALSQKHMNKSGIEFSDRMLKRAKDAIKQDGGDNFIYLFDVFRARNIRNMLRMTTPEGGAPDARQADIARRMDLNAIFTNPWLAGAYAQLGDAEYDWGDAQFAWVCWEQAARLKPELRTLEKMEGLRLLAEKEFPEYF